MNAMFHNCLELTSLSLRAYTRVFTHTNTHTRTNAVIYNLNELKTILRKKTFVLKDFIKTTAESSRNARVYEAAAASAAAAAAILAATA